MRRLRTDVWPGQPLFMGIFVLRSLQDVLSIRYTAFMSRKSSTTRPISAG